MEEETLDSGSNLGQRLKKIRRAERCLLFKGREIPVITKITIGRDKSNNVVIDDSMVSRFHAVIQKIKEAYFILDTGSRNGTRVNGLEVPPNKYFRLNPNDVIQIGRTDFSFL